MSQHICKWVSAALFRGNRILLIQREKEPHVGKWSLPGGSRLHNETIDQAMARELRQQTGYIAFQRISGYIAPFHDTQKPFPHQLITAAWTYKDQVEPSEKNIKTLWASIQRIEELGEENLTPDLLPVLRRLLDSRP